MLNKIEREVLVDWREHSGTHWLARQTASLREQAWIQLLNAASASGDAAVRSAYFRWNALDSIMDMIDSAAKEKG